MKAWRSVRRAMLLGTTSLLTAALAWPAAAEVSTDGSLGRKVTRNARDVTVEAGLGRRRGGNLFHSFERFGVPTGGSVTFTGPGGIDNVVSRVTGGERSDIDGRLASTIQGADFYLVNPAGIVFGPNASLDVSGSFHASTADELRFGDGAVFAADLDGGGSRLSVAQPRAFGFLGSTAADIAVNGFLSVFPGKTLSLTAGNVEVVSGGLFAPEGTIGLAGLGGPGSVSLATGDVTGAASGGVSLRDGSVAAVTGVTGGSVWIRGGQFVLANASSIRAGNIGPARPGSGVDIEAGTVLVGGSSAVRNDALGDSPASPIRVRAGDLGLLIGGQIASTAGGGGDAGPISIDAQRVLVSSTPGFVSTIATDTSPTATGDAGDVTVRASRIEIDGTGGISSATRGAGRAGDVRVQAEDLTIRRGGSILNATLSEVAGDAGEISVEVTRARVSGEGTLLPTGIIGRVEDGANGDAGSVRVRADELEIRDGGQVGSNTFGAGDGGETSVDAGRLLIVADDTAVATGIVGQADGASTGDAGAVAVRADAIEIRDGGEISSNAAARGDAGPVSVDARDSLQILNGGVIAGTTSGAGDGGAVTVRGGSILIDGQGEVDLTTGILAQTEGAATGAAGSIAVAADALELRDGGKISASTFTAAGAGTVAVAAGRLLIDGAGSPTATGVLSNTERSGGDAGQVRVTAGDLRIRDGGAISSSTRSGGDGGDVLVEADRLRIDAEGSLFLTGISGFAQPGSTGSAGSLTVRARDLVLRDGGAITSDSDGAGRAGAIDVEAGRVVADEGFIRTAGAGAEGGRIDVTADDLILLRDSQVTSSGIVPAAGASLITLEAPFIILNDSRVTSLTGDGQPLAGSGEANLLGDVTVISSDSVVAGSSSVEIAGLQQNLGSGLQVAPGAFLDTGRLLRASCAARGAARSSFTAGGRGGLPPAPDRPLGSAGVVVTRADATTPALPCP